MTSSQEKTHFTIMLACCIDHTKLNSLLIFFKKKTLPKGSFHKNVVIRCNKKGWVNENIMLDWFQEVWKKPDGAFSD